MNTGKAEVRAKATWAAAATALLLLSGCGPVKLVATTNIPPPLVMKLPVSVALFVPQEFSTFAHDEERSGTDWHVELGRAQTDGLTRLLNAMFENVVLVESLNDGSAAGDIRAILEPSIEEYAFVTPRDAGSPFYAVSIKYRMNVYTPDGRLADSWGFTGYGTAPAQGISSDQPLTQATALALRDAGAKLAVEFRDQAIVRGLLPDAPPAEAAGNAPAGENAPTPAVAPTDDTSTSPQSTGEPPAAPESSAPAESNDPAPPAPENATPPSQAQPKTEPPENSRPQSLASVIRSLSSARGTAGGS